MQIKRIHFLLNVLLVAFLSLTPIVLEMGIAAKALYALAWLLLLLALPLAVVETKVWNRHFRAEHTRSVRVCLVGSSVFLAVGWLVVVAIPISMLWFFHMWTTGQLGH